MYECDAHDDGCFQRGECGVQQAGVCSLFDLELAVLLSKCLWCKSCTQIYIDYETCKYVWLLLRSLELGPLICKEDRIRFYRGTHHGRDVVLKVSDTAEPIALLPTCKTSCVNGSSMAGREAIWKN